MKTKLLFSFFILACLFKSNSQSISRIVGTSAFQDSLWVMDTVNFDVKRNLTLSIASGTITGINAVTKNPVSGRFYVILKLNGVTGRVLAKLDLSTGLATSVGNLGDNFSSMTFKGDTLFAVTGKGAITPKTLYKVDTSNANITMVTALGSGADGEIICYNPTDNYIYHWTGNSTNVFEKILSYPPYTVTNITISGTPPNEIFGAVHISGGTFFASSINSYFNRWSSSGNVSTNIGNSTPDDIRGEAFITCQRTITGTPSFCTGDSTALTAPVANSYQWYYNGSAILTGTNQILYVKNAGYYKIYISDLCGSDSLAPGVTVQQFTKPTVSISGGTGFCSGGSVLLTGTSGGTSQWYYNGVAIPSATLNTYSATAAGVYNMVKTNLNGCADSAAVGKTITAYPTPSLTTTSSSSVICSGVTTTISVNGANTYTWSTSVNGSSITVTPSVTSVYSVSGTSSQGCIGSGSFTQVVSVPVLTITSSSSVICSGNSATLTVTGAGTYTWNASTPGSSIVVSPSVTTGYLVMGTDTYGCAASDSVYQTVSPCTGINSATTTEEIRVYPNPNNGIVNVALTNKSSDITINIYNALGQRIISQQPSAAETTINMKDLPNGIYILKILESNKSIRTVRIIKE